MVLRMNPADPDDDIEQILSQTVEEITQDAEIMELEEQMPPFMDNSFVVDILSDLMKEQGLDCQALQKALNDKTYDLIYVTGVIRLGQVPSRDFLMKVYDILHVPLKERYTPIEHIDLFKKRVFQLEEVDNGSDYWLMELPYELQEDIEGIPNMHNLDALTAQIPQAEIGKVVVLKEPRRFY